MAATIKIDENLAKDGQHFFSGLGLDLTTAVNMFIIQSIRQGKIPFTIGYECAINEEIEDMIDAKIADEAYEEYVKDGCQSRPMSELYQKYGLR